jgi:hypothetical protein
MGLQPATELFSLSDYRKRHALYRHAAGLYCCLETCTAAVAGAVVLRGGSCHTALAPAGIGNMGVLPFVCFSAGRTQACRPCLPLHPSYPHGMITVRENVQQTPPSSAACNRARAGGLHTTTAASQCTSLIHLLLLTCHLQRLPTMPGLMALRTTSPMVQSLQLPGAASLGCCQLCIRHSLCMRLRLGSLTGPDPLALGPPAIHTI